MKSVPIVLVGYNGQDFSESCIESIYRNTDITFDVIAVNNGSKDDTAKLFQKYRDKYSNFHFVNLSENKGFSGGYNAGMKYALDNIDFDHLLILNNDIITTPKYLSRLLDVYKSAKEDGYLKIGAVGPVTNYISGVQCVKAPELKTFKDIDLFSESIYENNRSKYFRNGHLIGFAMLFTKEMLLDVGLFDERFWPGEWEDSDINLRMQMKGYVGFVASDVFLYHYGSKTCNEVKKEMPTSFNDNRKKFIAKWNEINKNGTHKKLVGVCRVKNGEIYLNDTLESVSRMCDELVVFDDHSTDKTEEICKLYSKVHYYKSTFDTFDEARDRNFILDKARELGAEWIYCFPEGHKVLTLEGYKNIEDITINDKVLSHNANFRNVLKTYKRDYSGELCSITTDNNAQKIKCTPNHSFLAIKGYKDCKRKKYCVPTCNGHIRQSNKDKNKNGENYKGNCRRHCDLYKPEWIEASNLEKGDFLLMPEIKDTFNDTLKFEYTYFKGKHKKDVFYIKYTDELFRLFGYYLAEGFFSEDNGVINFCFNQNEIDYHKDVLYLMKKYFDLEGHIYNSKDTKACTVRFSCRWLGDKFVELFGKDCYTKKFPINFLYAPNNFKLELLKGWFLGDGNWNDDVATYTICTTSNNLSFLMQKLCISLGINVTIRIKNESIRKICKNKKLSNCMKQYILCISGINLEKIKNIEDHLNYYNKIKDHYSKKKIFNIKYNNIEYTAVPISFVETENFSGQVYNFAVEGDNSYTVNNIIAHNCFDADEVPEESLIREVQSLLNSDNPFHKAYIFKICHFWNSPKTIRLDGVWGGFYQCRLFKVEENQKIRSKGDDNLHSGCHPEFAPENMAYTKFRIKHYGNMDPHVRKNKYEWYTKTDKDKDESLILGGYVPHYKEIYYNDPKAELKDEDYYRHIIDENKMELQTWSEDTSISVCIIAKNEEKHIENLLKSVTLVADEIIVTLDSTSTDKTEDICRKYTNNIYKYVWNDTGFSGMRNFCMSKARGAWILFLDGDEIIPTGTSKHILEAVQRTDVLAYLCSFKNWQDGDIEGVSKWELSENFRLFKNIPHLYFNGVVHEELSESVEKLMDNNKFKVDRLKGIFYNYGYLKDKDFVEKKHLFYGELLKRQLEKNPNDFRAHMNYAVHLTHYKQYEEAEKEYKKTIELNPNFWKAYNGLGVLYFKKAVDNDYMTKAQINFQKALSKVKLEPFVHSNSIQRVVSNIKNINDIRKSTL